MSEVSRKKYRWGILGTGRIAQDFVMALQGASHRGEVLAVASRHLSSSEDFAQRFGIPKAYGSYEDLLEDLEVDVVYVAALQHIHADLTIKALKKKKPVLCEKPLAINQAEVELVLRCSQQEKVFVMEALWMSFFPLISQTRRLISSGILGEIKFARADFGWKNDFNQRSALTTPEFGGGSLLAVGCYVLTLAFIAFQSLSPSKVHAQGEVHQGVDHQTFIQLEFSKDQHAQVFTSISMETEGEALIIGTKGKLRLPFPFLCPTKLIVTLNQGETWPEAAGHPGVESKDSREHIFESPLPTPHNPSSSSPSSPPPSFNFINSAGLVYEAEEVHNCLDSGSIESSIVSHDFSLALVKLMDNVRRQIGLRFPMEEE